MELEDRELSVHPHDITFMTVVYHYASLCADVPLAIKGGAADLLSSASLGMCDLPSDTTGLAIISGCSSKPGTVVTIKYQTC